MPFNIQIIDSRNDNPRPFITHSPGEIAVYETGQIAALEVERRKDVTLPHFSYRIIKIEDSGEESDDWKTRERERFVNGQYERIPWHLEAWSLASLLDEGHETAFHFPHMSKDKTGMIAYTESAEKGRGDIQKRMRPGKYLTKYFYYGLTARTIRYWAGKVSLLSGESQEYQIAMTPDEIENVYLNGPSSCMSHGPDYFCSGEHPVRMYGAGDLGVAYITREDSIAARVIVWPDKKIWGRVYGDGGVYQDQLKELLKADGYEGDRYSSKWTGARFLRVEDGGGFIMPYLDMGGNCLTDDGDYLRISPCGEIDGQSETGVTGPRDTCYSCNEGFDSEVDGGTIGDYSYCQSCYGEYAAYCEDCDCTVHIENSVYLENIERSVCDSCSGSYPTCDSCNEQFEESNMVCVTADDSTVCSSCFAEDYFECYECGDSDKNENMQTDDSNDSLCVSCHDARVESGETTSGKVENENQTEMFICEGMEGYKG